MNAVRQSHAVTAAPAALPVFSRILVGVDASAESRLAARQAAQLLSPGGSLELLAAYQVLYPAAIGGIPTAPAIEDWSRLFEEQARAALERVRAAIGDVAVEAKLVEDRPADALLAEAERVDATLVAVGTHGRGRTSGILLGSVATEIVHRAPCSVLVARGEPRTLRTIVVGLDGSPESKAAYDVAAGLADRFGATLWPVSAFGGDAVDRRVLDSVTTRRENSPDPPVEALVAAAADADLVIVGSRGLHGLKALGSVSERVAHEAGCSTLVVRPSGTGGGS